MRTSLAALALFGALVAAGCGGSGGSGSSSPSPSAAFDTASLAPKDAAAWVVVDTDQSSAQWQALEGLLKRIPGAESALDNPSSSPFSGGEFRRDVLPAVGKQLILVLPAGASDPIVLAHPDDKAKLEALLAKSKEQEITGDVGGWTAIATSQQSLDAYRGALGKGTLSGSDALTKAMAGLPEEAIVRGYADGKALAALTGGSGSTALTKSLPGAGAGSSAILGAASSLGVGRQASQALGSIGVAVTAEKDALRLDATLELPKDQVPPSFAPKLLGQIPADALVALAFHGGDQLAAQLRNTLGADALKQTEQQLGVSTDDLVAAFDGEGVLYVRAGAPIPEITLALQPKDPAKAKRTLDSIVAKLGTQAGAALPLPGLSLTTITSGDTVLVSTSREASLGGGQKLSGTERFKRAAADVGLGDSTSGFGFVDVRALGPLLRSALGALGGGSDKSTGELLDALGSLDSLAFNATADAGTVHVKGILRLG